MEPVPEPGGYPCFPGNIPDWTIWSGSKPELQPCNLALSLTLTFSELRDTLQGRD
jgi:hypothetical protein